MTTPTPSLARLNIRLARDSRNQPHANLANAVTVLEKHPSLKGRIWSYSPRIIYTDWNGNTPHKWADADTLALTLFVQRDLRLNRFSEALTSRAVRAVASMNRREADPALCPADATTTLPTLHQAETLLRWLHNRQSDVIALTTVYQTGNPQSVRNAQTAREAMRALADQGWLIPLPDGAVVGGKHHKEAWRIVRPAQGDNR